MVDSTPLIPGSSDSDTKQGQRVFGCCDSRRAVIVINSVALALSFVGLISKIRSNAFTTWDTWDYVQGCISILFNIIVLYSALKFQYVAVIVAIVWAIISISVSTIRLAEEPDWGSIDVGSTALGFVIFGIVLGYSLFLLFIYAHCVYVSEVRKGIMSRETHSRETYSCCCGV